MMTSLLCLHDFIAIPQPVCFGKMKRQAGTNFCCCCFVIFQIFQSVTGSSRPLERATSSEGARLWLVYTPVCVHEREKNKKESLKVESGTIPPFSWQFGVCRPTGAGLSRSRNFSFVFFYFSFNTWKHSYKSSHILSSFICLLFFFCFLIVCFGYFSLNVDPSPCLYKYCSTSGEVILEAWDLLFSYLIISFKTLFCRRSSCSRIS